MTAAYIDTLPTGEDSPWWLSTDCDVVHRSTCRHARHPWLRGRGWPLDRVRQRASVYGLRLCRVCLPERSETSWWSGCNWR